MSPADTSRRSLVAAGALAALGPVARAAAPGTTLLNVSYDPTRELYKEINAAFAAQWKAKTGQAVTVNQSHGGSGKQARAVIDGLEADVVTLALAGDIDEIAARAKLLPANWQTRLPFNSTPYTSTIVFLVRKGNPKQLRDWPDLLKPGVQVIASNPKTSGGARWAYLAAYAWGLKKGGDAAAQDFVKRLYHQAPLLPTGSRDATTAFAQRGQGDVLLSWENEAYLTIEEFGPNYEIVYPSQSILAEPPVALVDKNVDRHNTRPLAQAYLQFLYAPGVQLIIGKHHFRPRDPTAQAAYAKSFKPTPMVTIANPFGGWAKAQAIHFADGGVFDRIMKPT